MILICFLLPSLYIVYLFIYLFIYFIHFYRFDRDNDLRHLRFPFLNLQFNYLFRQIYDSGGVSRRTALRYLHATPWNGWLGFRYWIQGRSIKFKDEKTKRNISHRLSEHSEFRRVAVHCSDSIDRRIQKSFPQYFTDRRYSSDSQ